MLRVFGGLGVPTFFVLGWERCGKQRLKSKLLELWRSTSPVRRERCMKWLGLVQRPTLVVLVTSYIIHPIPQVVFEQMSKT